MKKFDQFVTEMFDAPWGGFGGNTPPPKDTILEPQDAGIVKKPDTIEEDGEGNTTTGVANYQSPIGSSQPTAKRKDQVFVVDSNAKNISGVTSRGV